MTPHLRSVTAWLAIVQSYDDLGVAEHTLRILRHYLHGEPYQHEDVADLLAMITAIRMDQSAKGTP